MIYAELTGGLGNQMFVYAFARALSLRCREPMTLIDRQDWQGGAPVHTVCALGALRIPPEVRILPGGDYAKRHLPLQNALKAGMIRREQAGGMMARDWHPFEAKAAPWLNRLGLHFVTDGYIPCRRGPGRHLLDLLAWGYFQGEAYFADFRDAIRAELRPAAAPDPDMAAAIAAAGVPVCLHIRRGGLPEPGKRRIAGLHAGVLCPLLPDSAGQLPRRGAVCLFRRHSLGAGSSGHRRAARPVCGPRQRRRGPGADADVPAFCHQQFHLQLVGPVSGRRAGQTGAGPRPLVRQRQTECPLSARVAAGAGRTINSKGGLPHAAGR